MDAPVCVMLGNETHGLSDAALQRCHTTVRIELFGMSESLNLSVSAAILLHTLCHRRRIGLDAQGDLNDAALRQRRATAYARSVDPRLLRALL
jgi:tRNA (guanosine-2'-O-)-methyltransferase